MMVHATGSSTLASSWHQVVPVHVAELAAVMSVGYRQVGSIG